MHNLGTVIRYYGLEDEISAAMNMTDSETNRPLWKLGSSVRITVDYSHRCRGSSGHETIFTENNIGGTERFDAVHYCYNGRK